MSPHLQAGIVAFVGGLAFIDAETPTGALLILFVAVAVATVILIAGKDQ